MSEKKYLIAVKEGAICTLTINNPAKRNALNPECFTDIGETFEDLASDKDIRVVILRGAGEDAFSAGADIAAMPSRDSDKANSDGKGSPTRGNASTASEAIQQFPFPVIAMLYGYTLGDEIARCAPLSLKGSKYILSRVAENPVSTEEELETFRALQIQAAGSDDHEEAKKAFREKRKPIFKGA